MNDSVTVYVLTSEPYHENSTVMGVYRTLEAAQAAFGTVGPCRCLTTENGRFTSRPTPGNEKHPTPGWEAQDHKWAGEGMWSTTCETASSYGQIQRFTVE